MQDVSTLGAGTGRRVSWTIDCTPARGHLPFAGATGRPARSGTAATTAWCQGSLGLLRHPTLRFTSSASDTSGSPTFRWVGPVYPAPIAGTGAACRQLHLRQRRLVLGGSRTTRSPSSRATSTPGSSRATASITRLPNRSPVTGLPAEQLPSASLRPERRDTTGVYFFKGRGTTSASTGNLTNDPATRPDETTGRACPYVHSGIECRPLAESTARSTSQRCDYVRFTDVAAGSTTLPPPSSHHTARVAWRPPATPVTVVLRCERVVNSLKADSHRYRVRRLHPAGRSLDRSRLPLGGHAYDLVLTPVNMTGCSPRTGAHLRCSDEYASRTAGFRPSWALLLGSHANCANWMGAQAA